MGKFRRNIIYSIFLVTGILLIPNFALAAAIDVDFPGSSGAIITETNILPGNVFSRTVTIEKLDDADQKLMIRFDAHGATEKYSLAKKMLVKIKRMSGTIEYLDMPNGTKEQTLEELYDYQSGADDGAFAFDIISGAAGSTFPYNIQFTFDPMAGNEFQGKTTVFDISMGIFSSGSTGTEDDGDDDDGNGHKRHHHRNQTLVNSAVTGAAGPGAPVQAPEQEVAGVSVPEEGMDSSETQLAGAETICQGWPKWVWIIALLAFVSVLWRYLQKNYREEKMVWKFAVLWTVAAVVFWYYGDKCREYKWFLYGSIAVTIASYFFYLWRLKKKVKNGNVPIDSGQIKID